MADFTPHELVDLIVNYKMARHEHVFIIGSVLEYPQPVSVNELYYAGFHGKQTLTTKGEAYKDALSAVVARSSFEWKRAHEMVYHEGVGATLLVVLYFESLKNKSWTPGGTTKKGSPQQPLLIKDASNYIKVIEDGVSDGTGINDCNNTAVLIAKEEDARRPRTELVYIVA